MKLIKLTVLAALTALAAGLGTEAKAQQIVGTTSAYSTLNIAMTITTNTYNYTVSGNTVKYMVGRGKLANKDILNLFAQWAGKTWPAGAKLEYDWESNQVIVADKTGGNVLFYVGNGVSNDSVTAWLNVDWFNNDPNDYNVVGQYTDVYTDRNLTSIKSETGTEYVTGRIELFYQDSSTSTDLYATGLNTSKYTVTATSATDNESFTASGAGVDGNSLTLQNSLAAVTATVKSSGKARF